MAIDPSFGMPFERFGQTGSFVEPVTPPVSAWDAGTLVQLPCVNVEWLRLLLGAATQLINPSTWDPTLSDSARVAVLQQATDFMAGLADMSGCCNVQLQLTAGCVLQISMDGGATFTDVPGWDANFGPCVVNAIPPAPSNPRGTLPDQATCNLAGFLASEVIQGSIALAVADFNATKTAEQFGRDLLPLLVSFGFVATAAFASIAFDLYDLLTAGTIADFTTASTDPVLKGGLTCAIFTAIEAAGGVTDSNFPTLLSNVCGISYAHPEVTAAICTYLTNLGAVGLRELQQLGALVDEDCSLCSGATWCYVFTGATINTPPWVAVPGDANPDPHVFTVVGSQIESKQYSTSEQLHIAQLFSPDASINAIEITFTAPEAANGADRRIETDVPGCTPPSGAGTFTTSCPRSGAPTNIMDIFVDSIWPSTSGHSPNFITEVKVRGTGTCPFGTPNCT